MGTFMGMTITLIMTSENLNNQEEDPEIEEGARGTENHPAQENLLTQENLKDKDKDLEADKVDRVRSIEDPKMKVIVKNNTDQIMKEEEEGVEVIMVLIEQEG